MEFSTSRKYGFVVSNPPYGERIGEKEILPTLYKHMGNTKKKLEDWDLIY